MSKYRIIRPVDFGPWTIGDKNYGPNCPSCKVPLNNYAPKVGDSIEGEMETASYYVYYGNQKQLKTGRGVKFVIATNGHLSTQGQYTVQFIPEDNLALELSPTPLVELDSNLETSNLLLSENQNDTKPVSKIGQTACWICENAKPIFIGLLIFIGIVILFNAKEA